MADAARSRVLSLGYLGLTSPDLNSWRTFATEIAGMAVSQTSRDGDLRLRIDGYAWRISVTPGDGSLAYVGWEVADKQALEALANDLDVTTPAAAETEQFYVDVLGFRVSDRVSLGSSLATFAYVNPRHHSVAVVESSDRKLHHFMLETTSLDTVGLALDRALSSREHSPVTSLGRHANDLAVSCYLRTPSECQIEYGWAGRQLNLDPATTVVYNDGSIWGHKFY